MNAQKTETPKRGGVLSARLSLSRFMEAKADFEKISSMPSERGELSKARENLFLAARLLDGNEKKGRLEAGIRLSIGFAKAQLWAMKLAIGICEYFLIPATLLIAFRLTGKDSDEAGSTALMGLKATAASFILKTLGIWIETAQIEKQQGFLEALRDAADIARNGKP